MRATRLPPTGLLAGLLTAAVLAVAVLAAGCATPVAPGAGAAPGTTVPSTPAPGPGTGAPDAPAVDLPWPARSAAEAAGLQGAADSGAQPWLLDPEETALAYAAAAHGWTAAGTERTAPDAVLVTGPGGARRTLTLVQPARTGPGGIWSVTTDR
nr:hypothetical protein [uncultured bacterium]